MADPQLDECIKRFARLHAGGGTLSRPSERSLRTIESALRFRLPSDFVEFAARCPSYDAWFASIGDDYEAPMHILKINEFYRDPKFGGLPHDLIVINHGYDGDLNCYDLRNVDAAGRISICYCWVRECENPGFEDERRHQGYSISEYLKPGLEFWEKLRNEHKPRKE